MKIKKATQHKLLTAGIGAGVGAVATPTLFGLVSKSPKSPDDIKKERLIGGAIAAGLAWWLL